MRMPASRSTGSWPCTTRSIRSRDAQPASAEPRAEPPSAARDPRAMVEAGGAVRLQPGHPTLSTTTFDLAQVNGAAAGLNASEQINLVDSSGHVIGTPSAPDGGSDGFNACGYA